MAEDNESPQFSISLPNEAIEIIEKRLKPYGMYGKKRATICRNLILERLRQLVPPTAMTAANNPSIGETPGE
jgi:hypothetical protein